MSVLGPIKLPFKLVVVRENKLPMDSEEGFYTLGGKKSSVENYDL